MISCQKSKLCSNYEVCFTKVNLASLSTFTETETNDEKEKEKGRENIKEISSSSLLQCANVPENESPAKGNVR